MLGAHYRSSHCKSCRKYNRCRCTTIYTCWHTLLHRDKLSCTLNHCRFLYRLGRRRRLMRKLQRRWCYMSYHKSNCTLGYMLLRYRLLGRRCCPRKSRYKLRCMLGYRCHQSKLAHKSRHRLSRHRYHRCTLSCTSTSMLQDSCRFASPAKRRCLWRRSSASLRAC